MNILLTGATGYIGKRLLPELLEAGHHVICCVRDRHRFDIPEPFQDRVEVLEIDFLEEELPQPPAHIDVAYFLIHSMSSSTKAFDTLEARTARNFLGFVEATSCEQLIYLSGIYNEKRLSKHLQSRKAVEDILSTSRIPLTVLRAGIIVGSGSASFEIIRDLVEKLPVMIAPKWLQTQTQPIAVRDVIVFLTRIVMHPDCMDQAFDIGGPDVLTYEQMLLQYAEVRGFKRIIISVPVMTPRLSSYWLYFITSTSYNLAVNLVDSMKIKVVARDNRLAELLDVQPMTYKEAIKMAFDVIQHNLVPSSWKDSAIASSSHSSFTPFIQVPEHGCFTDEQRLIINTDVDRVLDNIWSIGGDRGWYYGNVLWRLRGFLDKVWGGIGLRRGRTNVNKINPGDALDFWRVLVADKQQQRLLLYAEMKLPGEAWLEFKIRRENQNDVLYQTATFRPAGLWGRVYWMMMLPFHLFIFRGMAKNIIKYGSE